MLLKQTYNVGICRKQEKCAYFICSVPCRRMRDTYRHQWNIIAKRGGLRVVVWINGLAHEGSLCLQRKGGRRNGDFQWTEGGFGRGYKKRFGEKSGATEGGKSVRGGGDSCRRYSKIVDDGSLRQQSRLAEPSRDQRGALFRSPIDYREDRGPFRWTRGYLQW